MWSDSYGSEGSDQQEESFQEHDLGFESDKELRQGNSQAEQSSWTVVEPEELARVQDEALAAVMNILGCSTSKARTLLIHFSWDQESLFGVLAERDEDYVCKLAGCPSQEQQEQAAAPSGDELTCNTCFCDVPHAEATAMECGHAFCNDCWRQHLTIQIQEGKARRLPCMAVRCRVICDEGQVKALLAQDRDILAKYECSLLQSFVEDNAMVRWCPSVPSCGRAIRVTGDSHCQPQCRCSCCFCFACGEEAHSPCTCNMWKSWRHKCVDDSETHNWINANSKACPKCGKQVEKNGGCNLVRCMCGQTFCWLCGRSTGSAHNWERIDGHSCGRYRETADARISAAAKNIKRFQHYQQHWEGQQTSQRMEDVLRAKVDTAIKELEVSTASHVEHAWLPQALGQLKEARGILGLSYVFAFYMFGGEMFGDEISPEQNQLNQNLFEDQQQMLQVEVEKLAAMVSMDLQRLLRQSDEGLRLAVINCAASIDTRFWKMYDVIENDLLGSLQSSAAYISPYKGVDFLDHADWFYQTEGQSTMRVAQVGMDISLGESASILPPAIDLKGGATPPRGRKGQRQAHSPVKRARRHVGD